MQLAEIHNATVDAALAQLCDMLPAGPVQNACKGIVEYFGPGSQFTANRATLYSPKYAINQ